LKVYHIIDITLLYHTYEMGNFYKLMKMIDITWYLTKDTMDIYNLLVREKFKNYPYISIH